ncbi:MAG: aminopeptidase [Crocinitomicaceae bacterium]|nr:aminopeptidase [Crocinitomicaceae bacterium]
MKRIVIILALFFSASPFAQEFTTNTEGSEYKFEKLVHLDATPVQSQGWTGTCWSFSALSFFESEIKRSGKGEHVLAEMYIVYQAYLGKAEKYIRTDGNTNFDEGGAFHDIPWVISRFGIVPNEVFIGLNYGTKGHNHSELTSVLKGAVNGLLEHRKNLGENQGLTTAWLDAVRGILNAYLGYLPENAEEFKFKYNGKDYNPITFRDELGLNMDNYYSLTSFTNHELYQECRLEIADNWVWDKSYNVTMDELWAAAEYSLMQGYTFAWAADVSEDYFDFRNAIALVPKDKSTIFVEGENNKNFSDAGSAKKSSCFTTPVEEDVITTEMRQLAYDNKRTTDDHGMHAVGLYKDAAGKKWLLIKNSWGTSNDCDGYMFISEAYFKYKTINIYLHKEAIPKDLKKKIGIE